VKLSFRFPATAASLATRAHRRRSLLLACIGIAVLPLAWRGTSCGHDFDFHLESWLEVLRHWHEGVLYPHWSASANYGAGEPRFVFYPPLSWMLGALLGAVLPWTWTPLVFTLICLLGLGVSFFAMAREWMPEDNAALAACLCVLNPYLLFTAYERTAYGELLGAACIPLLILFGLRKQPSILPLSLTIAAMWLTDAPVAVMGCYALAVLVLVSAIQERSFALILRSLGAVPLGIGLAAFYLVPALYEQRWVEIARAIGQDMRVEDSFLFGYTAEPYHNQVLRTASWVAVTLMLAAAVAAWLSRPRPSRETRNALWLPVSILAALIVLLHFRFSDFLWRLAPELKFLQFPWRWLLVLGILFAAFAGLALRSEATTRRTISLRAIAMLLLAVLMAGLATVFFWQPCDDEDNVRAQMATMRDGGFAGTDEYTAQPADNGAIQQDLPPVRVLSTADADEADSSVTENPEWQPQSEEQTDKTSSVPAGIHIERWQTEHITATITTEHPAWAVFRLMNYPAWRILLNGKNVLSTTTRGDGLVTLPVASGENRIDIRYRTTEDVWGGRVISIAALFLLLTLTVRGKKERRVQVS
jgi:uncharacterized membrane protein